MKWGGGPSRRVIIAEDEPIANMALRAQLEALGHEVLGAARNGRDAVALGRCLPVDVAVFDMKMPGLNGLDAAARLFEEALIPAVLITGYAAADLPQPLTTPPIFASLTKPIGLAELQPAIQTACDRFETWTREAGREVEVRAALEDRVLVARALHSLTPEHVDLADAARELVRRAAEHQDSLPDAARATLGEG